MQDASFYSESEVPLKEYHDPQRVLIYHIAAVLDVKECTHDFLDVSLR